MNRSSTLSVALGLVFLATANLLLVEAFGQSSGDCEGATVTSGQTCVGGQLCTGSYCQDSTVDCNDDEDPDLKLPTNIKVIGSCQTTGYQPHTCASCARYYCSDNTYYQIYTPEGDCTFSCGTGTSSHNNVCIPPT